MLEHTFCHVPKIGPRLEYKLWRAGIHRWADFFSQPPDYLSQIQRDRLDNYLTTSQAELQGRNPVFFAELLPAREHWRLFEDFRKEVAYLDIETSGLHWPQGHITTIALYDGCQVRHYVHDRNLEDFARDIDQYQVVVTYNGKSFDIPFIEKALGIKMRQAHIDLRYILSSLGLQGGLKSCEQQLGIARDELDGVDGFFAVLLWRDFHYRRNAKALETLLAYNVADTINLERLTVLAYNLKLEQTPFGPERRLPLPAEPANPFVADMDTILRLKQESETQGFF